jgi:hypothetical protein
VRSLRLCFCLCFCLTPLTPFSFFFSSLRAVLLLPHRVWSDALDEQAISEPGAYRCMCVELDVCNDNSLMMQTDGWMIIPLYYLEVL